MSNNWLFTSSPRKELMCVVDELRMIQQFCAMEIKSDITWTYILSNLTLRTFCSSHVLRRNATEHAVIHDLINTSVKWCDQGYWQKS